MPVVTDKAQPNPSPAEVKRILKLQVPVIVRLASKRMSLAEVMRLGGGGILEFDKANDAPLELLINNTVIGEGEAVKVGENFGLRISRIGDVRDKLEALGGR